MKCYKFSPARVKSFRNIKKAAFFFAKLFRALVVGGWGKEEKKIHIRVV